MYHNNLVNTVRNAWDSGYNSWDNGYGGNYWSDYTGSDENGDGKGDTPYIIPGGSNSDYYPYMDTVTCYETAMACLHVVSIKDVCILPSESINVPIKLHLGYGHDFSTLTISLYYDKTIVWVDTAQEGNIPGSYIIDIRNDLGRVTITWNSRILPHFPGYGDFTFATIGLRAIGDVGYTTPLSLMVESSSWSPACITNGSFGIWTMMMGDTNGDNCVDTTDLSFMTKYLVGLISLNKCQLKSADFGCNGFFDIMDVELLAKWLVGIIVIENPCDEDIFLPESCEEGEISKTRVF